MHLLSTKNITAKTLENLFDKAEFFRSPDFSLIDNFSPKDYKRTFLQGKVLGIIKDEGSTRTRLSFEVAMKRLGGEVVLLELDNNSSISKGESIEDTVRTISEYVDVIAMRSSKQGEVQKCAKYSKVPVINMGDGSGEHPTQALLDVYTIWRHHDRLDNLNIMLVGDLKFSRTVHSLLYLLSLYKDNKIYLVSDYEDNINFTKNYQSISEAIKDVGKDLDVLYMTRCQKERHLFSTYPHLTEYDAFTLHKEYLQDLKSTCQILHPLPRNEEIPVEIDSDPRAYYFIQVKNGLYIRMAILANILTGI